MEKTLPADFADLESLLDWSLPTTEDRIAKRSTSTMEEIRRFYDAMVPRADAAMAYLEGFPLDDMPDDAKTLFALVLALGQVSVAIEIHGSVRAPNSPFPHGITILRNVQPLG